MGKDDGLSDGDGGQYGAVASEDESNAVSLQSSEDGGPMESPIIGQASVQDDTRIEVDAEASPALQSQHKRKSGTLDEGAREQALATLRQKRMMRTLIEEGLPNTQELPGGSLVVGQENIDTNRGPPSSGRVVRKGGRLRKRDEVDGVVPEISQLVDDDLMDF